MTTARDRARLCVNIALLRQRAPAEAADLIADAEAEREIGDRLTALLRRVGILEGGRPSRSVTRLPLPPSPPADLFVCPAAASGPAGDGPGDGACDRFVARRIGVPTPQCAMRGVPLRLRHL